MSGRIAEALLLGPTDRIADIGSGTGLFAREVAKHLQPRHPILCVDPSGDSAADLPGGAFFTEQVRAFLAGMPGSRETDDCVPGRTWSVRPNGC